MAEAISTAGLTLTEQAKPTDPRREVVKVIRTVLRNQAATEDEVDDALEALIELAKD
jgi:hypothetical protein